MGEIIGVSVFVVGFVLATVAELDSSVGLELVSVVGGVSVFVVGSVLATVAVLDFSVGLELVSVVGGVSVDGVDSDCVEGSVGGGDGGRDSDVGSSVEYYEGGCSSPRSSSSLSLISSLSLSESELESI